MTEANLSEVELSDLARWRLQRKWWRRLLAQPKANLHRHIKPGKLLYLDPVSIAPGLELSYYVFREYCEVQLFINVHGGERGTEWAGPTPEDQFVFNQLANCKMTIEGLFGGELVWDVPAIGAEISGGFLSPDADWDDIHSKQVRAMNRLHAAILPHLGMLIL